MGKKKEPREAHYAVLCILMLLIANVYEADRLTPHLSFAILLQAALWLNDPQFNQVSFCASERPPVQVAYARTVLQTYVEGGAFKMTLV